MMSLQHGRACAFLLSCPACGTCMGPQGSTEALSIMWSRSCDAHNMAVLRFEDICMAVHLCAVAGPVQEFNIMSDPHAASIVFNSGAPVTMVPIEVTHTVLASPEVIERISRLKTPFSDRVVDLINFFADTYKSVFQFDCPPIHDAVAVAYVIQPHIFRSRKLRVDVELCSPLSKGQTVCDVWGHSGRPANVKVVQTVDVQACWELIIDAIERCNESSPLNR